MAMGNAQVVFSMKADATQLQAALRNVQGQATLTFKTITANAAMAEEATAKSAISLAGLSTVLGGFKLPLIAMQWGIAGQQIAEGALELVKAGVSGSELMSVLGAITMATATGFVDFQTAANLYITTTRAFAKEGLTAVQVFDMIQAASNAAIVNVEEFSQVLQTAASTL